MRQEQSEVVTPKRSHACTPASSPALESNVRPCDPQTSVLLLAGYLTGCNSRTAPLRDIRHVDVMSSTCCSRRVEQRRWLPSGRL